MTCLVMTSFVLAGNAQHLYLVEKNPSDWSVLDGSWAKLTYTDDKFSFNAHDLEEGEYTLLTYGGWTNVACFGTAMVNDGGNLHLNGAYDFDLMTDEPENVPVKVWLVKSSDVNCEAGKMTAWNPTEYLFEK